MKKTLTMAVSGLIAATIAVGTLATPAEAGKRERRLAAGIAGGAIIGAIIANEVHRNRKHRRADRHYGHVRHERRRHREYDGYEPRYYEDDRRFNEYERYEEEPVVRRDLRRVGSISADNAHISWCYDRYRSYRERDNSFQPYHGPRRQCHSPYD